MKSKQFFSIICLVLVFALLPACRSRSEETSNEAVRNSGLNIVTSFYPIYSMVKSISGDLNDVKMVQSGAGIHSFEPSASDIAAIYDADLFFYHSHILEPWASQLDASSNHSTVEVIEASKGMTLQRVKGLEEMTILSGMDDASLYDPHTWLDPEKVAEEAEIICQKLLERDPANASTYQENLSILKKETKRLVETYLPIFEKALQKTFVTQHTAFSYLADRFGLTQLGIAGISPDQEPTSRQLSEIEEFVKTYQVKTIFVESNASDKVAQTISRATGAQLKVLNPLEADPNNQQTFLENLEKNLQTLANELKE